MTLIYPNLFAEPHRIAEVVFLAAPSATQLPAETVNGQECRQIHQVPMGDVVPLDTAKVVAANGQDKGLLLTFVPVLVACGHDGKNRNSIRSAAVNHLPLSNREEIAGKAGHVSGSTIKTLGNHRDCQGSVFVCHGTHATANVFNALWWLATTGCQHKNQGDRCQPSNHCHIPSILFHSGVV